MNSVLTHTDSGWVHVNTLVLVYPRKETTGDDIHLSSGEAPEDEGSRLGCLPAQGNINAP